MKNRSLLRILLLCAPCWIFVVREPHFCFKSNSSVMRTKPNDGGKSCREMIPNVYQMEELLLIVKNGLTDAGL